MAFAPPPLHLQSSLEGVIDFSAEPPLGADQRAQARRRFYHIVKHFEAKNDSCNNDRSGQYNRPRLVRLTYEYARSEESQDNFLRAFFRSMELSMDGEEDVDFGNKDLEAGLGSTLSNFAEYLLDNFFLPLKASSKATPQPTPVYRSSVFGSRGEAQEFAGTRDRVSALRGACLVRDRHRCVISRRFDLREGVARLDRDGPDARDDDGSFLVEDTKQFARLEVAHILPHSLTQVDTNSQSNPSKQAALTILNMFDNGVGHLIEGTDIDRPFNALSLTTDLHHLFGDFRIIFEPTSDSQPHTYRIKSFLHAIALPEPDIPVTRTFHLTQTRTIDPPSPRLLAIHCAVAYILHLSAAGKYIDKILWEMEEKSIQADGSTELGRFVKLRLGGWLDRTVRIWT